METLHIRTAREDDLPTLHDLARRTLMLDSFSPELLAEKLFKKPRPREFVWETYLAESRGRPAGMMQAGARPAAGKAWLGLFAVDADLRRRGIASALFQRAKEDWPAGIEEVEVLAIPGNFFTPGLDPRYTEALCFLERLGFERFKDCVNLTAELSEQFDTSEEEQRIAADDIKVRRAHPADDRLLDEFFAEHFGDDWRFEAGLAMDNDPPTLHLALKNDRIIAFSAHSTQNREWGFFGPMGTAPEARGKGVGRVLLWHCLNDMRAAGHHTAVIPWVGPIAFYSQWARCRVKRVFWRYRLRLSVPRGTKRV